MDAAGCFEKALDLLTRRPHFAAELERKLRDRGYPAEAIDQAIRRLGELNYLDDERLARDFVRERLRHAPEGPRRLRAQLKRRGVEAAIIDETLREFFTNGDLELARAAAERWRRSHRPEASALARHLDRKGFSKASILEIVTRDE